MLPPEEQEALRAMVNDYLTGATQGMQPTRYFLDKIMGMTNNGRNAFFQMVGKGMELFNNSQQGPAKPRFEAAPGGGRVMIQPTGQGQYIPDEQPPGTPGYVEIPQPPPGSVGVIDNGRGTLRLVPPGDGTKPGTPGRALSPAEVYGNATGEDLLPESTPEEAQRRLRSMDLLFGGQGDW
jgi:hypothetical protein